MFKRRPPLRRLDLLVIGASPERLKAQTEILAARVSRLTDDEHARLYARRRRAELTPAEQLERDRLQARLLGVRR